jgi:transposase-like protein
LSIAQYSPNHLEGTFHIGTELPSCSAPRLASATARRHGISNQLLFAWRKAYREGRLGDIPGFVPALAVASFVSSSSQRRSRAHCAPSPPTS